MDSEIVSIVCEWTPDSIVGLISALAWPLSVLVLGLIFKGSIKDFLNKLISGGNVSEVSAGASGVTLRFQATKQSEKAKKDYNFELPQHQSIESIRARQEEFRTEASEEMRESIQAHISALDLDPAEAIELLVTDLSLVHSAVAYLDTNKAIFRSQFDLLNALATLDDGMDRQEIESYFNSVKTNNSEVFRDWDTNTYLSYLSSKNLISEVEGTYSSTKYSRSYVKFMNKKPEYINELSKL